MKVITIIELYLKYLKPEVKKYTQARKDKLLLILHKPRIALTVNFDYHFLAVRQILSAGILNCWFK